MMAMEAKLALREIVILSVPSCPFLTLDDAHCQNFSIIPSVYIIDRLIPGGLHLRGPELLSRFNKEFLVKTFLLATLALLTTLSASVSASGGVLYGTVQVGPYFNCAVVNNTPYNLIVTGIQYDYT